jgi:2'-5' RNA ligase
VARIPVRRCGGRPVPADNYHITLAFLGHQPAALCDDIVAAGHAVSQEPLKLVIELDRFGYWPKPRVFWFGPAECPPSLTALALHLWTRMAGLGLARDTRALQPHVTLCRKVQRAPQLDPPGVVRWRAAGFALVESVTAQQGAEYTVVERFPL